jgi:hypothetical protein
MVFGTAFTDGCPGLRRILLDAGVAGLPILDWSTELSPNFGDA